MGFFDFFKKQEQNPLLQDIKTLSSWISQALRYSQYKSDFSLESLKEVDRFFDEQNTENGLLNGKNRK